jgi:hypothetical protein
LDCADTFAFGGVRILCFRLCYEKTTRLKAEAFSPQRIAFATTNMTGGQKRVAMVFSFVMAN